MGLILAALLTSSFLLAACGKKVWPTPQLQEDLLFWESVSGRRIGDCLVVEARLRGNWSNLQNVALQLQPVGEGQDCPTCPFVPRTTVEMAPGSPLLAQDRASLNAQYCGLAPEVGYRWRLVAYNLFSVIAPEFSPVQTLP